MYKSDPNKLIELKNNISQTKKKRKIKEVPLDNFMLISDEEDN